MSVRGKEIELQLLGWGESHNSGCKVTFAVHPEDLEYFKNKTERKGKIAGQIFMAVLVEVDGVPEKPVTDWKPIDPPLTDVERAILKIPPRAHVSNTSHFPGGLCGLAVRWCDDAHFQQWLELNHAEEWWSTQVFDKPEEKAKKVICSVCEIDSRKQLDTAIGADRIFRSHFLEPYAKQRLIDRVDEE